MRGRGGLKPWSAVHDWEMAMKCDSCGSENPQSARFCLVCGQAFAMTLCGAPGGLQPDRALFQHMRHAELWSDMAGREAERYLGRIFGGLSWLMVSVGTFLIAFGWLGLVNNGDGDDFLRFVGYGTAAYAIAALIVSVSRFVKSPG